MEFFPPGKVIDVMKYYRPVGMLSAFLVLASLVLLVYPGPRFGTDFAGGTELELKFNGSVSTGELRSLLGRFGYTGTDVISVQGQRNQYILRVRETSTLSRASQRRVESTFRETMQSQGIGVRSFAISEGGDKVVLRLEGDADPAAIQQALERGGAEIRIVSPIGATEQHRFEAQLRGIGDRIIEQLRGELGNKAPEEPLRAEWVGPRAGRQLQESALQAVAYALIFIMLYIAFRFDIRFAPGAMLSLVHDVIITLGVYVLFRREVALTTVAALLTILGYSINDTIVVYDRIRENMGRERGKTFAEIVNVSTSQVLSRSIITSGTTVVSILPFLYFGTPTVKDIALAFCVGMSVGTYSSIIIAAPITEWFDRTFFKRDAAKVSGRGRKASATA